MASRGRTFRVDRERQSNKYLFSTVIKCKECGWSFRRITRTYRQTHVRWVCSGHNGKGAQCCPDAIAVEEEVLIQVLQKYFTELLREKKNVVRTIGRDGSYEERYLTDEQLEALKAVMRQMPKVEDDF